MVFYYQRIKAKYIQYHEVFEQDGKFGEYFKNKKQTLYEPQQPEGIAAALRKTAAPERGKTNTELREFGV